jgi:signal transduction histidine kinase
VDIDFPAILRHTRDLQRATTIQDLLDATRTAVRAASGYDHVWLAVFEPGTPMMVRVLAVSGGVEPLVWERAPIFPVEGDAMLRELVRGTRPVVVEDARIDPRTDKAMVAKLGNRTLINIPLLLGENSLGTIGTGTFGDEGVRPPTPSEVDHLSVLATHVAAALERVRILEERRLAEREREQLRQRLIGVQRIESLALLAGGVAHDFNNLLTVIGNSVRFVLETPLSDDQQRLDLEAALEATSRATSLTRQLLAMGRQQNLHLQGVDLNLTIAALVALLRRLLPENITLDFIQAAQLPTVQVDPTQLDQVFMNLCLNARDAMPNGGRLTIETEQVVVNGAYAAAHPWAKPGRYVMVTTTDTGEGMAPEVRERVFEPFFTTKPTETGTGLGLAVAAGVVEQHGGLIHCYSEVGVGTTFKVYLPAYDRGAGEVGSKLAGSVPRGTERVLIAEDESAVRDITRRILTRAGYDVVTVSDGFAAVEAATAQAFDLVLLDAVMPIATGRQAYDKIRGLQPKAAFLFASGHSKEVLPAELLAAAGVELVDKPYHPDDLLRAVRRALDARRA